MAELIFPSANGWIDAAEAGQKAGLVDSQVAARRSAGGFMANGDYAGAAKALYGAGDIADGASVASAGYAQAENSMKLQRQHDVQAKLASGDLAGAYQAAATDKDLLASLDAVTAHAKDTTATMAAALQALKDPNTGQWLPPEIARQKYAEIKPGLAQRGIPQQQLDSFDPTPDNLQAIQGQVLGLDKQIEMTKPMVVGHDLVTPQGREVYKGDDYKTVGPGESLVRVGGHEPAGSAPVAGSPAAAPAQPTAAAPGGTEQPRGIRNNNPLNVTALPHGQWDGQTGLDGQYAVFSTPEAGMIAADKNLQSYATHHGINTLSGIITRWSPPSENDTNGYISTVSKDLGVAPDQPLNMADPGVRSAILHSMAKVELGQSIPAATAMPHAPASAAVAAAAPAAAPGGATVVFRGVPQWRSDGQGHLINDATGDRKIDPTGADQVEANPDLVKAIIDGRAPVPTANRAATDPKWQAAMAEAMRQDPTLDAANYGTRVKTRADFATGTAAKTKTALNTALGHAGDLDGQIDGLHNTPIRMVNMVGNTVADQTGDPRIKTFNLTKEALMHEAMKVFSGSAGSMTEFTQLADTLNVNDSPQQQHSVIRKLVGLLASKMDALGEQYKTGMGKELDLGQIMSPHAQDVFSKIQGLPTAKAAPSTSRPSASPAAPRVGDLVKGYRFLGGDPSDPHSWAKN